MKRTERMVVLTAFVLLCAVVGSVSAFRVVVCTDGLERTASLDKLYEFDDTGTLLSTYEDPFPESHLRWQDMEQGNDGMLYLPSNVFANVYSWDSDGGSYAGVFANSNYKTIIRYPTDSVFSPDGSYYYVLSENATQGVARFDGTTGAFVDKFIAQGGTGAGITIGGPNGNIFISIASGGVEEYDITTGAKVSDFCGTAGTWPSEITWHNNELFFSQGSRIIHVDSNGTEIGEFVTSGSIPNSSNAIGSFRWAPDGVLYVCASANVYATNGIYRFNGTTGAYIDTFAMLPADARPTGIAFTAEPYIPEPCYVEGYRYFQEGVNGYTGAADTYINNDSATPPYNIANFGGYGWMLVSAPTYGRETAGLVRFDDIVGYGPGQIPYEVTVTSATLRMTAFAAKDNILDGHHFYCFPDAHAPGSRAV